MAGEPSFYQLFRRSRYSAMEPAVPAERRSNHEQKEVFAVAALAFTLRHEQDFLTHLLEKVCGLQVEDAEKCDIRCQDGHKSDLAIVWPGQRVIVVEAKIGASLKAKQNPMNSAFYAKPDGYGFQIKCDYQEEKEKFYVVLAKDVPASPHTGGTKGQSPTFLGFHQWGELEIEGSQSELVSDLLDSLGCLGIPELHLRSFMKKELGAQTQSAVEMFKLLEGLADYFRIPRGKSRWEIDDPEGVSYFGVKIPFGGRFKKLSQKVGKSEKIIGWFGYESRNGKPLLSVWFYPGDEKQKQLAEKFVARATQLPVATLPDSGRAFYITPAASTEKGDVIWFQDFLDRLSG